MLVVNSHKEKNKTLNEIFFDQNHLGMRGFEILEDKFKQKLKAVRGYKIEGERHLVF